MAQRLGVCCRSLLCLIYWLNILARSTAATSCWNQRNIDAVWREFVPYTDDENDVDWRLNGILPLVVEDMLAECCYAELAGINYTAKSENAVDLEKAFNSGGYGIALPVAFKVTALGGYFRALNGNTTHFIPVIESPGSVLVMTVNKSKQIGSDLVNIIFDGWPLLLIIIVSAGVAGIVMWLLDRWRNPIEFPRPFIRGFWEGFWWAFVTMTTVGYGDRSPRSIPARLFGIIWIIVGVAILSVFTAIVTTEMTENTFAVEYNLQGMKVGVVNGTEEHRVALDSGAEIAVFTSHREMLRNPVSDLDGYLVDQYFTAARANEIAKHGLGVAKLVHNPVHYGVMVTNMEDETIGCFHDYVIRTGNASLWDSMK
ncbi:uncharacterized protein [Ptychodera flava]|uniref:uncharacterized protein n=1 Tax=Ptychodera flava TaxID=63121 RepID=UPI003969FFE2